MARARWLNLTLACIVAVGSVLFGSQSANAANCASYDDQCTEGAAKQGALAWSGAQARCRVIAGPNGTVAGNQATRFVESSTRGFYTVKAECRLNGVRQTDVSPVAPDQRQWFYTKTCQAEPSYTGLGPWSTGGAAKNGSLGCRNGCDGMWSRNSDSSMTWSPTGQSCPENEKSNCENYPDGYYWNAILNVCEPPEGKCGGRPQNSLGQCAPEPCPAGMTQQQDGTCKNKDNECPAGQIKSPDGKCLPGDGQCAQGEVRGKDGTCKKDSDGDGQPDEGEEGGEGSDGKKKDEFSGGDDCKTPPTCSGSPIMCGQARIQWRIDCNTRRNRNIAGGACTTPPVCTGEKCDALEYSGLLMQWRTACATEKLAQSGSGGDGTQPAWTKVTGMSTDPGAGSSADDLKVLTTKTISVSDLDQSGIGGGGSCMGFASGGSNGITSGFMSAIATPPAFFCQYIAQIKALIITIAAVAAAVILARGGN